MAFLTLFRERQPPNGGCREPYLAQYDFQSQSLVLRGLMNLPLKAFPNSSDAAQSPEDRAVGPGPETNLIFLYDSDIVLFFV